MAELNIFLSSTAKAKGPDIMAQANTSQEHNTHHELYALKNESYFGEARSDYIGQLPESQTASILEIGCGNGATGALALASGKCGEYIGVEVFEPMATKASAVLTKVHLGNVETMELPYAAGHFDALVMSEVLEHLVNPEAVVEKIIGLIKPGGYIFASSPNIAHWRLIARLIKGRFEYENQGIMDESHVHWFTPGSFEAMFNKHGVSTVNVGMIGQSGLAYKLAPRSLRHLFVAQISFVGRKL